LKNPKDLTINTDHETKAGPQLQIEGQTTTRTELATNRLMKTDISFDVDKSHPNNKINDSCDKDVTRQVPKPTLKQD
jgi:hypothetical protein